MIKLRNILENKLEGLPIQELIDKFLKFDEKTLIFFDTETMGLNPEEEYCQITQLGVMILDGSTMKVIKKINLKVGLNRYTQNFLDKNSPMRQAWDAKRKNSKDKTPEEILDMTKYFDNLPEKMVTEEQVIQVFKHVVETSKNPIIVAHNAKFDMSFISVRGRQYGIMVKRVPVIDTKKIAELFFIPALMALNESGIINSLRKFKLVSLKAVDKDQTIMKDKKTEFERYTDPITGEEFLKIYYGHPSTSLGKLSPALLDKIENWHDALADVQTMIAVFSKIIEFLREHPDLDVTPQQAHMIGRAKLLAKKAKNDRDKSK